jgi:taurine dioxygenase
MRITKLTGALGAVIEDVRLESIDDHDFKELHDALLAHQVVFLPGQNLSEDGQRALAHRFGTPSVFPISKHLGSTEFLGHIEDSAESPPDADGWHTDITWIEAPPKIAILCGLEIPAYGGDTMWADLYGAYDRLSEPMKRVVSDLKVWHSQGDGFWAAVGRKMQNEVVADLRSHFPGAEHPLVRLHPETGKRALFVAGGFMQSIVGMHPQESEWMLDWLRARVDDPNVQVRWHWHEGDVAIWDERCTNHRALSDHYPQNRHMRRCTIDGEVPIAG